MRPVGIGVDRDLCLSRLLWLRGALGRRRRLPLVVCLASLAAVAVVPRQAAAAAAPDPTLYHTVTACRLFDSRSTAPLPSGGGMVITAAGQCGVAADAVAVAFNVTVVAPTADGHLTLYDPDGPVPGVSTINFAAGRTRATNAVVRLSAAGAVAAQPFTVPAGSVHLILDVSGYFSLAGVAADDTATVAEDAPPTPIDVLANDSSPLAKQIAAVTQPPNGTVTITNGGADLTYEPAADFCTTPGTTDDFTYTMVAGTSATVRMTVTCVNDDPTDIALDDASVGEGQPTGTLVGTLSTTDVEPDPHSYALVAGGGDTGNASFQIVGDQLRSNAVFDLETQASYSIRVQTDDGNGGIFEEVFTITVTDANDAPTDIALSATSVEENQPPGTAVGTLSTTDQDAGDTHTYALVAGAGDTDNGSFQIVGDQLQTNAVFDFETRSSYIIRVQTDDGNGGTFEEVFTLTVTDVNEQPTDIALSAASIAENQPSGTAVGTLSTSDPDPGDSHSYALVAGTGDTDNGSFQVVGNQLQTDAILDFETKSSYSIRVQTDDGNGGTFAEVFTITVTDANDTPTDIALSATVVDENQPSGTAVGTLSTTDQDAGDTHTYALVAGAGDTDNGSFQIVGDQLQTNAVFDFETKSSHSVRVQTDDGNGGTFEEVFTLSVTDVNEAPTDLGLSGSSLAENNAPGAQVGTLSTTDPDLGQTHTYTLVAGAGDTDNASFQISGSQLQAVASFDFETKSSYTVRVRTTDDGTGSLTYEEAFTITVTDVNEVPTDLVLSNAAVDENQASGTLVGSFSTVDPDAGDTHVYALVAGAGSTDNAAFAILSGNQLRTAAVFDFETKSSYSIRVQTRDLGGAGLTREEIFTITVNDLPEPPITNPDAFDAIGNTLLEVDASDSEPGPKVYVDGNLLANDVNPEAGAMTASLVSATAGALVTVNSDGTFTYLPPPGHPGATDSFTYAATNVGGSTNGTVTIDLVERVWYVANDATAGGDGRSTAPFDTLAEAQVASAANDWIFVYFGDGTTTGQAAGIALKNGQHLIGEHVGLELPVGLNGNATPTVLVTAAPGDRPLLDDTVGGAPDGVAATDVIPAEIAGLNLAGNVNAIDWTTLAGFAGSGALSIRDNVVRSAGQEGIDLNLLGTGAIELAFHDNTLTATGIAADISRSGGALTITAFDDNVVTGTSASAGIQVGASGGGVVTFDQVPGGAIQTVSGGNTAIGAPGGGNGVGNVGLVLNNVAGALSFTDLDVYSDTSTALIASADAGGFTLDASSGTGTLAAAAGAAVDLNGVTADVQLASLTSNDSPAAGVVLTNVGGTFSAAGGVIANAAGPDFWISGGTAEVTFAGNITDDLGQLVSVANTTGGTKTFSGAITDLNDGDGSGISLTNNTGATITFSGGLELSTGLDPAFTATGGGTIDVSGLSNTATTTNGTGLVLDGVTLDLTGGGFDVTTTGTGVGVDVTGGTVAITAPSGVGDGLDITTGSGTGFRATGAGSVSLTGTLNSVSSATGRAVDISGGKTVGAAGIAFASTSSGGGTIGINLENVANSLAFGNGALTNHTTAAFMLTNSAVHAPTITYAGNINPTGSARPLDIGTAAASSGMRGGTITLSGLIGNAAAAGNGIRVRNSTAGTLHLTGSQVRLSTGANAAVELTTNPGATFNFSGGGLDITTSTGTGFLASGRGTIHVTGASNTINTTNGQAFNVFGTAAQHMGGAYTFKSISSANGTKGISLQFHDGPFSLTGDGVDGDTNPDSVTAGGTIANASVRGVELIDVDGPVLLGGITISNPATGGGAPDATVATGTCGSVVSGSNTGCYAGIHVDTAADVSLHTVIVTGSGQTGINGRAISDLAMNTVTVSGSGNSSNEDGIRLFELTGSDAGIGMTNVSVQSSFSVGLYVANTTGTLASAAAPFTISNSSFQGSSDAQGVLVVAFGSATEHVKLVGGTISGNFSNGFHALANLGLTGTLGITVDGTAFSNNAASVVVHGQAGTTSFDVRNTTNTARSTNSGHTFVVKGDNTATMSGDLVSNTIGTGVVGSGASCGGSCNGINVDARNDSEITVEIRGNTVQHVDFNGIDVFAGQGTATVNATITGNLVRNPDGAFTFAGVFAESGIGVADPSCVTAQIGGLTAWPGSPSATAAEIQNRIEGAWGTSGVRVRKVGDAAPPNPVFNLPLYDGSGVNTWLQNRNSFSGVVTPVSNASGGPAFGAATSCP